MSFSLALTFPAITPDLDNALNVQHYGIVLNGTDMGYIEKTAGEPGYLVFFGSLHTNTPEYAATWTEATAACALFVVSKASEDWKSHMSRNPLKGSPEFL